MDENRNSNISSEHSEELLNIIENFRLMDDTFMSKVFEDKACAELLLRVILNRDDLTVVRVVSQFELKNLQGRSARLDIYAVDEHDVLKGGKPLYTVNRTISELDHAIFTDGSHIIYVNGEIRNGTALGELMQDFFCKDPREMHYKVLSDRAGYFKKDKEGVDTMCKLVEDYGEKRAKQAQNELAISFAIELWNDGIRDMEKIAKMSKLPLDEVKKLFEGKTA